MYRRSLLAAVWILLFAPVSLYAQTPVNPNKIVVTASPDHANVVAGTPVVDHYEISAVATAGGALAFTKQLGKPTPNAANDITANVPEFLTVANGLYTANVVAVGPGGVSTPASAPFARIGPPAPPSNARPGQ